MIRTLEGLPGWIWAGLLGVWHWSPGLCIVVGVVLACGAYLGVLEVALRLQDLKDVRNRR